MFKIISGDFDKSAKLNKNSIIESKGDGLLNFKYDETYLYNAESVEVLQEPQIKELLYQADYSLYTKDLQKALKGTDIVCFEYKYKNGKSFRALSDLGTFHKIQKSSKNEIDENELKKENLRISGNQLFFIFFAIYLLFICFNIGDTQYSSSPQSYTWSIGDYKVNAEDEVKRSLKAPSTAKFPSITEWVIEENDGITTVMAYVDSQNSYGANIRTYFELKYEGQNLISKKFE